MLQRSSAAEAELHRTSAEYLQSDKKDLIQTSPPWLSQLLPIRDEKLGERAATTARRDHETRRTQDEQTFQQRSVALILNTRRESIMFSFKRKDKSALQQQQQQQQTPAEPQTSPTRQTSMLPSSTGPVLTTVQSRGNMFSARACDRFTSQKAAAHHGLPLGRGSGATADPGPTETSSPGFLPPHPCARPPSANPHQLACSPPRSGRRVAF